MKKVFKYLGFWIWSLTWGCIVTAIGLIVAIFMLLTGHRPHRLGPNIYFKIGNDWGGFNLGPFFVVSKNASLHVIYHEAGHGLQNLIWGPLMLLVICIPSFIRYWYRNYLTNIRKIKLSDLPDYEAVWFESQATRWGFSVYNDPILLYGMTRQDYRRKI